VKAAVALAAIVALPVLLFAGLLVLVAGAARGAPGTQPSGAALVDIPGPLVGVYRAAAASCPLPWPVLAAIGKVETDHGRSTLPGVARGTANSAAGAEGPMQFLPSTWATYGVDANGDGVADIYDPVDAIWGAARLLCANGAGNPDSVRAAVFSYNHADWYVVEVMRVAASYTAASTSLGAGQHALPVAARWFHQEPSWLTLAHHDYPAIDIPVPVGTPAFAAAPGRIALAASDVGACGGTVIIDGGDGARYTYCHLSAIAVADHQRVAAGDPVGASGGAVGAPSAGDSTGPHLHFGIAVNGVARCPQLALAAWASGLAYNPTAAPTNGCTT
jgi:murein DD-endopeptidase MepM/ murein hydrolase activator NlpD